MLTATYRDNLAHPDERARESIADALNVAATLPPDQAVRLVDAARDAFLAGIQATSLTTTAILVVVAALALAGLRGVPKVIPDLALEDGRAGDGRLG